MSVVIIKMAFKIPKTISEKEFLQIVKAVKYNDKNKEKKIKTAFMLGFYQCLRISEVVNLQQENVDIERGFIHIISGKGDKDADIPIMPPVIRAFKHIPINYSVRTLQREIKRWAKETIGKDIHFHALRHCLKPNVQVLTLEGWKYKKDLKLKEKIATLNMDIDKIEFKPIKKINEYDYNDYLNNYENEYLNYSCTPEHKMVVRKRASNYKEWILLESSKVKSQAHHRLSAFKEEGFSIGKDKAAILGWILSDGSIVKKQVGKALEIKITQSLTANKEKCDIIEKTLDLAKIKYTKSISKPVNGSLTNKPSQMVCFRLRNSEHKFILKWIHENRTPKWDILKLKGEELEEIYNSMMLGDGSKGREYCGQNKNRIDFFMTISHILNKRTKLGVGELTLGPNKGKPKHRVHITNKDYCMIEKKHETKKWYKGKVWCPTVENGIFLAKKDNKIFITGNSGASYYLNEKKVDVRHIQSLLRHSRLATTEIYTHVTPNNLKKVFDGVWE